MHTDCALYIHTECAPYVHTDRARLESGHLLLLADPTSGHVLHGPAGARYSEVRGARALLGYAVRDSGALSMLEHPVVGTRAYPATIFTDAPPGVVEGALRSCLMMQETAGNGVSAAAPEGSTWRAAETASGAGKERRGASLRAISVRGLPERGPWGATGRQALPGDSSVLFLHGASYRLLDGRWGACGLSVDLARGSSLLVRGPSGCGKTTLLRCLSRLGAFTEGEVAMPERNRIMFLPQKALMAPPSGADGSSSLREQVRGVDGWGVGG